MQIRREQLHAFDQAIRTRLEDKLISYYGQHPEAGGQDLPPDQMRSRVAGGVDAAYAHGLDCEKAIFQFVSLRLAFGDDFHSDSSRPWIREVLEDRARDSYDRMLEIRFRLERDMEIEGELDE